MSVAGGLEAERAYKREWAAQNPGKTRLYRERWNAKNPKYLEINKARLAAGKKIWWQEARVRRLANNLLRAARRRAQQRQIEFAITVADIFVPESCPLLDIPLTVGDKRQGPNSPTLDRIDNQRGYVPGNVWVISLRANVCKGALTADEIIQVGIRLKASLVAGTPPTAGRNSGLQAGE